MSETTRRRPGGRSARVRRAVLDATLELVNAHGLDGVTVAEVAERAGVHETSIYRRWRTREELRLAIVVWIEKTYHRRRRQDTLGRLTPIEFETLHQAAHAA